jgi:hypothetical protein
MTRFILGIFVTVMLTGCNIDSDPANYSRSKDRLDPNQRGGDKVTATKTAPDGRPVSGWSLETTEAERNTPFR